MFSDVFKESGNIHNGDHELRDEAEYSRSQSLDQAGQIIESVAPLYHVPDLDTPYYMGSGTEGDTSSEVYEDSYAGDAESGLMSDPDLNSIFDDFEGGFGGDHAEAA